MRQIFSPEKVAAIQADIAAGLKHREIGAKHNIHISSVSKVKRGVIGKAASVPADLHRQLSREWKQLRKAGTRTPTSRRSKYVHLIPQIRALREQKYTLKEIAAKLNIPETVVSYRLYGRGGHSTSTANPKLEGASSNGHLNKNIAIGIAYAETERFIGVLAQRLGVPTDLLRSRLSELLGRSPIR